MSDTLVPVPGGAPRTEAPLGGVAQIPTARALHRAVLRIATAEGFTASQMYAILVLHETGHAVRSDRLAALLACHESLARRVTLTLREYGIVAAWPRKRGAWNYYRLTQQGRDMAAWYAQDVEKQIADAANAAAEEAA